MLLEESVDWVKRSQVPLCEESPTMRIAGESAGMGRRRATKAHRSAGNIGGDFFDRKPQVAVDMAFLGARQLTSGITLPLPLPEIFR